MTAAAACSQLGWRGVMLPVGRIGEGGLQAAVAQ